MVFAEVREEGDTVASFATITVTENPNEIGLSIDSSDTALLNT
jgi:hypothetical protein